MTSAPRVVLAPDKFKGSLSAAEVAAALARGMRRVRPGMGIEVVPVADGGDGTLDAFVTAGWTRVPVTAPGPTGEPGTTSYALRGDTAVIELAAVVGFARLPGGVPDPLGANTFGLGVLIAHALDRGVSRIVLGLGGSASTDGGSGMLTALGARILDREGNEIPCGGAALLDADRLDLSGLHSGVAAAEFTLACDVGNPLLGPSGAVTVYAPQKGAGPEERAVLEAALANWARIAHPEHATSPGAGAAGGTGFGALAVLGARMRSGIDVVLELLDFPTRLAGAILAVTGEGSLDEQTLHGKAPLGVCAAATRANVPVAAVAGRILLTPEQLEDAGFSSAYSLTDLEPDPIRCIAKAAPLLERVGARIAESVDAG
ncbi:glycerate kinase [Nocardia donostiensis]|uniref:Glycerate kinase n=1 Tax=Nocardia donostiensis TaxID=1538463 RepID=A0A1V2TAS3_9NOCA|nr:glycerate kinase [Nocardia donostiensis]ONM46600.1 glycerate kinase [Nocardia donostiensis]OQS12510.1 glycerate kinase [Nocardia donostiensis]OQS19040.1 glycerate kinase [Nocardia donostiensis]